MGAARVVIVLRAMILPVRLCLTLCTAPPAPSRTLVLDNGAYTLKAGFVADDKAGEPVVVANCLSRDRQRHVYVGSDLDKCKDFGEMVFRRPVEKGYIVNWEAQREIWHHEFLDNKAPLRCDPSETRLVLTEQSNALPVLQANCDQMVFEEFQFASYYRGIGKWTPRPGCPAGPVSLTLRSQVPSSTRT